MEDQERTPAPTDSTEGVDTVSPREAAASAPSTEAAPLTGTPHAASARRCRSNSPYFPAGTA
jgi:hypothetical protein